MSAYLSACVCASGIPKHVIALQRGEYWSQCGSRYLLLRYICDQVLLSVSSDPHLQCQLEIQANLNKVSGWKNGRVSLVQEPLHDLTLHIITVRFWSRNHYDYFI